MKKLIIISIFITAILFITACGGDNTTSITPTANTMIPTTKTSTTAPTTSQSTTILGKITIADSTSILNLLPLLPETFEKVDAASEGLSNSDMDLGPECSEVELFFSEEPFQMIYGFYGIEESRIARASTDATFKDEAQIKKLLIENIKAGLEEENLDASYAQTSITYPDIADLAVYGEGQFEASGVTMGFDLLWFRVNKVYVFLYSIYYGTDYVTLDNIAKEITHRIGMYSQ